MRILTWCYSFWPGRGGLERILPQVTLGLAERGHEVIVVTQTIPEAVDWHRPLHLDVPPDDDHWNHLGPVPVHRVPITTSIDAQNPAALARVTAEVRSLQRSFGADVAHVALFGADGLVAATTAGDTPWVVANHLSLSSWPLNKTGLHVRMLHRANRIVTVSEASRRETLALTPDLADRIQALPNGVRLTPDARPIPDGPPVVLAHGRLVAEKGFATLLMAHALLTDRRPDAHLVIAGDGYARRGFEGLATRLGITDKVTFTGWRSEEGIRELIDGATVVVVPSVWAEPFGLTALEAGERGRAVVASRTGGLPEIVVDGETGILVQAGDPIELAAAVDGLLEHPERAAQMGAAARRRVHAEFSLERCIDRYEAVLTVAAEEGRRA